MVTPHIHHSQLIRWRVEEFFVFLALLFTLYTPPKLPVVIFPLAQCTQHKAKALQVPFRNWKEKALAPYSSLFYLIYLYFYSC